MSCPRVSTAEVLLEGCSQIAKFQEVWLTKRARATPLSVSDTSEGEDGERDSNCENSAKSSPVPRENTPEII